MPTTDITLQHFTTRLTRHSPKLSDGVPHRDAVLHMLISLHMEGNKLDANALSELSEFSVSKVPKIPLFFFAHAHFAAHGG